MAKIQIEAIHLASAAQKGRMTFGKGAGIMVSDKARNGCLFETTDGQSIVILPCSCPYSSKAEQPADQPDGSVAKWLPFCPATPPFVTQGGSSRHVEALFRKKRTGRPVEIIRLAVSQGQRTTGCRLGQTRQILGARL